MFKKASLQLAVLTVLLFAQTQGNPVIENEKRDAVQSSATRDPRIGSGDWLYFNHSWSFPSLPSVTNLFSADEKEGRGYHLRQRVAALEKTQESIIEKLNNITRDVDALTMACAEKPVTIEPEITTGSPSPPDATSPEEPVTDEPEIPTEFSNLPEATSPERLVANKPEFPTELPSSPEEQVTNKPEFPTELPSSPEGTSPENNEKPEGTEQSVEGGLLVIPLKPMGNKKPNSTSGESRPPGIPEKIVIASTNLEDGPGENPFGRISLVGFVSPHDTRHDA